MDARVTGLVRGYATVEREVLRGMDLPYSARAVYAELAAMMNIKDRDAIFAGQFVTIKRGQALLSLERLASTLHMARKTLMRALALLQRNGVLERTSTRSGTIITLIRDAGARLVKRTKAVAKLFYGAPRGQASVPKPNGPVNEPYKGTEEKQISPGKLTAEEKNWRAVLGIPMSLRFIPSRVRS